MYGKVARPLVQYGERERPERRSIGLLICAQVAHAPRTVPLAVPYMHLQSALDGVVDIKGLIHRHGFHRMRHTPTTLLPV
jgi:hypothetical protein